MLGLLNSSMSLRKKHNIMTECLSEIIYQFKAILSVLSSVVPMILNELQLKASLSQNEFPQSKLLASVSEKVTNR